MTGRNMPQGVKNSAGIFVSGIAVGTLGGLIGLGGAEFRLPLLIGVFGFSVLPAIIINKATSLIVVAASLPLRTGTIPIASVFQRWDVILTLLAGSLAGAWFGAGWATRIEPRTLHRVLAALLFGIAGLLLWGHEPNATGPRLLNGLTLAMVGALSGFGIGVVASLMGVAGGELLIPTIVLLYGADIKLAGSLSLAVSLPTMIVGFTRYSKDKSFAVIKTERRFLAVMAAGSIVGAVIGGRLLGIIHDSVLLPILAAILVISAAKVWSQA